MSYEIEADYNTEYLLPPSIEEWVSKDHPARFVREFVDMQNLEELGFKRRVSTKGRPNYSASLLLKVWLYGYFEGICTSRKLEKACMNQVPLIWLTGNNAPDHNTLWRFYNENKKAIKSLFKQSVKLGLNAGLVGMMLHAVDGTIIKARGSKRKVFSRDDIEKIIDKLDESIEIADNKIEKSEAEERGEYRLPSELAEGKLILPTTRRRLLMRRAD